MCRPAEIAGHLFLVSMGLLAAQACGASTGGASTAVTDATFERAQSRKGNYLISWRPVAGEVPLNEFFAVEVLVQRNGPQPEAVPDAEVVLRCDMPAHGHGMNVEPRSRELGQGRYIVEGVLLHMTGRWVMTVDVVLDGTAESTEFELTLE